MRCVAEILIKHKAKPSVVLALRQCAKFFTVFYMSTFDAINDCSCEVKMYYQLTEATTLQSLYRVPVINNL